MKLKLGILCIDFRKHSTYIEVSGPFYEISSIKLGDLLSFLLREEDEIDIGEGKMKYGMGDILITFGSNAYLSYASTQEIADVIDYLTVTLLLE